MAKDAQDAPFGESLDHGLSATLRTVYSRVLKELAREIPPDRKTAVEAEVAAALVALANAGQRHPEQLRRYALYKARQVLP